MTGMNTVPTGVVVWVVCIYTGVQCVQRTNRLHAHNGFSPETNHQRKINSLGIPDARELTLHKSQLTAFVDKAVLIIHTEHKLLQLTTSHLGILMVHTYVAAHANPTCSVYVLKKSEAC